MGCGASSKPAYQPEGETPAPEAPPPAAKPEEPPKPAEPAPEPEKPTEIAVGGDGDAGITVACPPPEDQGAEEDGPVERGPYLPFARFDKTAVPKEILNGNIVYITFTYSGKFLGGGEKFMDAECTEADPARAFAMERVAGEGPLMSGDDVLLRHVDSGLYVEADSDTLPTKCVPKEAGKAAQSFKLFKQGRPMNVRHRDTVYLQSCLNNYVEDSVTITDQPVIVAKRWRRGELNTLTVLKKEIVESTTTELARKMQYQAFDLDGNGAISKSEMAFMLDKVGVGSKPEEPEFLDGIMGELDPALTGNIPFSTFTTWADSGAVMSEEQLQHAEVIGNMAQRCHDALNEEQALIEVLTVAHLKVCTETTAKYAEKFSNDGGENPASMQDDIFTKASEQDGWIMSNYWKVCLQGLMESEVDLWTRCLNDAMACWGTDEYSLTCLVCTMPERLRAPIFMRYYERFGKGLLEHIESETSGSYKKVLTMQAMAPEDCRATLLYKAMKGMGTDEDQLIRVIAQLDIPERTQVKEAFLKLYQRTLVDWVGSELSGNFKKALLCMLNAEEKPFDCEADCKAMQQAMKGWGTDEETLTNMICGKTAKQMEEVNAKFKELFDRDLLEWVKSETSGHFQATLMGCIRHPMTQLAHAVRDCVKGWGTSETGLLTLLVHLPDFKKVALQEEYRKIFSRDLIHDIKADCSGNYEKALLALVRPAPRVWAEAIMASMKGLGTSDQLLINFMCISKDEMGEVRKYFKMLTGQEKTLLQWVDGDCSGEYKNALAGLVNRNTEDLTEMLPIYWAQRGRDAVRDIDTLKDILVQYPSLAIKRGTDVFQAVYGKSLKEDIEAKCSENRSWFSWSNYYKKTMLKLLDMPVELYVTGLYEAMDGIGTDEGTLTALVCTIPENMYADIHKLYEKKYGKKLVDHIESETSFSYKKAMIYQCLDWPQSRARALNGALAGMGTDEGQLVRILVCSTMAERRKIAAAYREMYDKSLEAAVNEDTSGNFQVCLQAILESVEPQPDDAFNLEDQCNMINDAINGNGDDPDCYIRCIAEKTPAQIVQLREKFTEMFDKDLIEVISDEAADWGECFLGESNFKSAMLGLLRPPIVALACCVRDCIVGFGTDDTGLITCLVHLSERRKIDLFEAYKDIPNGGNLFDHIKGDTSGDYEKALLALVKPAPQVWAEALQGAMAGLGTSDNLLINFMCIAKDRMDEVRVAFEALTEKPLAEWIDGDCGDADYKDLLIRLANRKVQKFAGSDVMLTIPPPPSKDMAIYKFNKCFNALCALKKANPDDILVPPEEAQQEMGPVFMFYGQKSSCAPNLDKDGLWDLTNAVGFPPADDGPDLIATFQEWNYSGSGEITWNDFVREMGTRINDPNHYEADPLAENEPSE
mmetsp:Transcript_16540/g.30594  ORF Transcript_16540/g.30594 Transcript_16540/m.30594 type:complete len:1387 (+) Transcript_16540:94-4254(+)